MDTASLSSSYGIISKIFANRFVPESECKSTDFYNNCQILNTLFSKEKESRAAWTDVIYYKTGNYMKRKKSPDISQKEGAIQTGLQKIHLLWQPAFSLRQKKRLLHMNQHALQQLSTRTVCNEPHPKIPVPGTTTIYITDNPHTWKKPYTHYIYKVYSWYSLHLQSTTVRKCSAHCPQNYAKNMYLCPLLCKSTHRQKR